EAIARDAVVALAAAVHHRTRIAAREERFFAEKAFADRSGDSCAVRIETYQLVVQRERYGCPDRLLWFAEFRLMDGGEGRRESRLLRAVGNPRAPKQGSERRGPAPAGQQQQGRDAETEGALQPPLRPIAPCNHPGLPPPCKTQSIFPPAQGDVMAQMRRIFLLPEQACDPVNRA